MAYQFFNIDKTGITQNKDPKKVVSVSGLRNVWSKGVEASFYMKMAASCSADGFFVPPLFISPGKLFNRDVMDQCCVPNLTITTATKGLMNASMFIKCLLHLEQKISLDV